MPNFLRTAVSISDLKLGILSIRIIFGIKLYEKNSSSLSAIVSALHLAIGLALIHRASSLKNVPFQQFWKV